MSDEWLILLLVPILHFLVQYRKRHKQREEKEGWRRWLAAREE